MGIGSVDEILPAIEPRIKRAQNFWLGWGKTETWENLIESHFKVLESEFGNHQGYIAIDNAQFPPKGLAMFEKENTLFFISIGMSIFAQPRVELYNEQPEQFRRIEIGMALDKSILEKVSVEEIGQFMSTIVAMPWNELCWFGHGHTLYSELFTNQLFNNVLLVDRASNSVVLPPNENDPVKLLWLIPITDKELAYHKEHSAENLIKKLEKFQNYWVHKSRQSAE